MSFIDAHIHVWTDDFARYPLAGGYTVEEMKPATFTPEEVLAHCRPCGVERIVLVQMSYYGMDNSYMLDTMARFPGVFGGIAVVDEEAAEVEAEMARLGGHGVRGFRLQPRAGSFDTPGYRRMFAHAAGSGQAMCCLMNPDSLPSLAGLCQDFPDTKVVIDHLCRIGVSGTIVPEEVEALCALARYSQVFAKVSAFYALGAKQPPHDELLPMIGSVVEAYGTQRLMWASDCPYQVQAESFEAGLSLVRDRLALGSEAEREWLLGQTAEGLFF